MTPHRAALPGTIRVISSAAIIDGLAILMHSGEPLLTGPFPDVVRKLAEYPGGYLLVSPALKAKIDARVTGEKA